MLLGDKSKTAGQLYEEYTRKPPNSDEEIDLGESEEEEDSADSGAPEASGEKIDK